MALPAPLVHNPQLNTQQVIRLSNLNKSHSAQKGKSFKSDKSQHFECLKWNKKEFPMLTT